MGNNRNHDMEFRIADLSMKIKIVKKEIKKDPKSEILFNRLIVERAHLRQQLDRNAYSDVWSKVKKTFRKKEFICDYW